MIGQKFGKLTVQGETTKRINGAIAYVCTCDCGGSILRSVRDLRSAVKQGYTPGCGCTRRSAWSNNGRRNRAHGCSSGSRRKLYDVWRQMLRRCYDPACKDYPAWGGRGIRVCDEWHDVRAFCQWAESSGYKKHVTIERTNNNGNYEPGNCRWIPNHKQASNTRRLNVIEAFGQLRRLDDWAALTGVPYRTIISRLVLGWDAETAITKTPVAGRNQHRIAACR